MRRSMKWLVSALLVGMPAVGLSGQKAQSQTRKSITTENDFRQAMKDVSNWGRWGADDEMGAANLITPAKRKQALALAREGLTVSLAHDIIQAAAPDGASYLERTLLAVSPTGSSDRYQYTGTYHGSIHSHLDAV